MRIIAIIIFIGLVSSCVSHKKITYFNDISESVSGEISFPEAPVLKLRSNDIVEIEISSISSETSQYFNRSGSDVDKKYAGNTYQIASDGAIDLPLVGAVQIGDLSTEEAEEVIKKALLDYLQKPSVNLRLVSFRITVLGEVETPGVYDVPGAQVNVLEALGYAGDMTIYGKRDNVLLIRNVDDIKIYQRLDLNSAGFMSSEFFYLQNNDVLYVEPSKGATSKDDNAYRILPLVLSSLTFLIVLIGVTQ